MEKNKKRKIIIILVVALVIAIAGITTVGISMHRKMQEATYLENLKKFKNIIATGASQAQNIGLLTYNVWDNAIEETSNEETNKFTVKSYASDGTPEEYNDFQDALDKMENDQHYLGQVKKLSSNEDDVHATMRKLVNPPKKYKEAYQSAKALYTAYNVLIDHVIYTGGETLDTFSNKFEAYLDTTKQCFNNLDIYLS